MTTRKPLIVTMMASALALAPLSGCEQLPGDEKTQGAVIGGIGGAVAGGAIADDNRLLGALIGGALGAGGGYLIGSQLEKSDDRDDAREAERRAREDPVSVNDARNASTADINNDGYVTLDEVVALEQAGFTDDEIVTRLERTRQFFELTQEQEDYLLDRGVSRRVVVAMRDINPEIREQAYARFGNDNNR